MKHSCIAVGLILIIALSCNKIKYYPDKEFKDMKTRILAHRSGGGETSPFKEYSIGASTASFNIVDGVEVDLQISKNRTIWLAHNVELPVCGGVNYKCFPECSDNQIITLDTCYGYLVNYTKLEDIFAVMASHYPNKYISLDVKAWTPCSINSAGITGMMNAIADAIISLTIRYNLQHRVLVESETASFLTYVKNHSDGIDCYLTSLGDFERAIQLAIKSGYTGVSFKYKFKEELSADHIQLLRRKGLKIQLWTVNSVENIRQALSINPDFIQTDNLDFFSNDKYAE